MHIVLWNGECIDCDKIEISNNKEKIIVNEEDVYLIEDVLKILKN